jgi:hypothetical protein
MELALDMVYLSSQALLDPWEPSLTKSVCDDFESFKTQRYRDFISFRKEWCGKSVRAKHRPVGGE